MICLAQEAESQPAAEGPQEHDGPKSPNVVVAVEDSTPKGLEEIPIPADGPHDDGSENLVKEPEGTSCGNKTPQPRSPIFSPTEPASANQTQEGEEDEDDAVPHQPPPEELTKAASEARLRRVMAPRSDGSFLVPKEAVDMWKDKDKRDSLKSMFQKCGHCPVP